MNVHECSLTIWFMIFLSSCEYICQHDIVCLVESMLDPQSIQFANYIVYNFARTVRHKKQSALLVVLLF